MIGKSICPVSNGVHAILEHLRTAEDPYLGYDEGGLVWIDEICINQESEAEKGHQIGYMKKIYSHASKVVIWLGSETSHSEVVMETLNELTKVVPRQRLSNLQQPQYAQKTLTEVIKRISPRLVGLGVFGYHRKSQTPGARSCSAVTSQYPRTTSQWDLVGLKLSAHSQAVVDLMPGPLRQGMEIDDLRTLLQTYVSSEASEDKDHIFALFGLCSGTTSYHYLASFYDKPIRDIIRAVIAHIYSSDVALVPDSLCDYPSITSFMFELKNLDSRIYDRLMQQPSVSFGERFIKSVKTRFPLSDTQVFDLLRGDRQAARFVDMMFDHYTYWSTPLSGRLSHFYPRDYPEKPGPILDKAFTSEEALIRIALNTTAGDRFMRTLC
ncbi:heterokaryon incompatibility protein-domain-containing protein [Xylariaceae sp. FL0255]|nr:heterokaryon incompatibility protein-domain-containing protein [Xylariaceae sp. FL0255]